MRPKPIRISQDMFLLLTFRFYKFVSKSLQSYQRTELLNIIHINFLFVLFSNYFMLNVVCCIFVIITSL